MNVSSTLYQVRAGHESAATRVKLIGVGGGACNAIDRMIHAGIEGADFIVVDTDLQALQASEASARLQIGLKLTAGNGAGGKLDTGQRAAITDTERIIQSFGGADIVLVVAALGGGTGTGAAPVIASLARETGALVLGIASLPFGFEGKRKIANAEDGVRAMIAHTDSLILIPNDRLLAAARDTVFSEAFRVADDALLHAARSLISSIRIFGGRDTGRAALGTVLSGSSFATIGTASAQGPYRAADAANAALASPLLRADAIRQAALLLAGIVGSGSLTMHEVDEFSRVIQASTDPETTLLLSAEVDEAMRDAVRVTLIAAGPGQKAEQLPVTADRGHVPSAAAASMAMTSGPVENKPPTRGPRKPPASPAEDSAYVSHPNTAQAAIAAYGLANPDQSEVSPKLPPASRAEASNSVAMRRPPRRIRKAAAIDTDTLDWDAANRPSWWTNGGEIGTSAPTSSAVADSATQGLQEPVLSPGLHRRETPGK